MPFVVWSQAKMCQSVSCVDIAVAAWCIELGRSGCRRGSQTEERRFSAVQGSDEFRHQLPDVHHWNAAAEFAQGTVVAASLHHASKVSRSHKNRFVSQLRLVLILTCRAVYCLTAVHKQEFLDFCAIHTICSCNTNASGFSYADGWQCKFFVTAVVWHLSLLMLWNSMVSNQSCVFVVVIWWHRQALLVLWCKFSKTPRRSTCFCFILSLVDGNCLFHWFQWTLWKVAAKPERSMIYLNFRCL